MALRSKLLAWSIALNLTTFLVLTPVHADPMTDSFTGKHGGSHKPAKKTRAPRSKPASKPALKPAARPTSRRSTRAASGDDEFSEPGEASAQKAPPPPREPTEERPRNRRAAESDEPQESSSDQGAGEEEDDDKPKAKRPQPSRKATPKKAVVVKKKARNHGDEDEEDEAEAEGEETKEEDEEEEGEIFTSLPVIIPHMVSLGLGGSIMGRNFQFAAPAQLQKETSFPRFGLAVNVETFPFLAPAGDWWRQFGLGIMFAAEPVGQASVADPSTGASVNTPVKQTRWGVDVRYVLPLGDHVVLTPGVGLLSSSFTLETKMPLSPSQCAATAMTACLPDTNVTLFAASGNLHIALAPEIGLSLGGAYLLGLGVKNKPLNQIGYESATSAGGFQAEVALSYLMTDWFALRGAFPITRVNYLFHTASIAYKSAAETYYGLVLQAVFSLH